MKTIKSIRLYIPHFRKSHKKKERIFNHNSIFIPFYRVLHAKINPSIRRREEHRTNAIISQSKWIKKKKRPYCTIRKSYTVLSRIHECIRHRAPIDSVVVRRAYAKCVKARFEKRKNAITSATLSRDSFPS